MVIVVVEVVVVVIVVEVVVVAAIVVVVVVVVVIIIVLVVKKTAMDYTNVYIHLFFVNFTLLTLYTHFINLDPKHTHTHIPSICSQSFT